MEQQKVRSYLLYAFGEVLLVVLGILIALQLNNWNEQQQRTERGKILLMEIKKELLESLDETYSDYNVGSENMRSTRIVMDQLDIPGEPADSMYMHFANLTDFNNFFPQRSAYENLKSIGFDLIASDSLTHNLSRLYELGYERILTKENSRRNAHQVLFPYFQEHFRVEILRINDNGRALDELAYPNNWEQTRQDPQFHTLLVQAYRGRYNFYNDRRRVILSIEKLITDIDRYIEEHS